MTTQEQKTRWRRNKTEKIKAIRERASALPIDPPGCVFWTGSGRCLDPNTKRFAGRDYCAEHWGRSA